MNVGITIENSYSLFSNGLNQNILFLYWLIKDIGHAPFLIDFSDPDKDPEFGCRAVDKDLSIIGRDDLLKDPNCIDILLMPGAALAQKELEFAKKYNPSLKTVVIHYGNLFFDDLQKNLFTLGANQQNENSSYYETGLDQIWLSPHYEFSISYYELMHRSDVKILPYIWDTAVMDLLLKKRGDFSYVPNNKEKIIGVTEPNINFSKNCFTPICILEKLYRSQNLNFEKAIIYGAARLADRELFSNQIINNFDLPHERGKIIFGERTSPDSMYGEDLVNILLSHQHYNSLNYGHLEALYLNYPLIHNSEELAELGAGYYYDLFDINEGAKAIEDAILNQDKNIEEYMQKSSDVLTKYSIKNELVKDQYKKLIDSIK